MNPVNVPLQPVEVRNVYGLPMANERLASLTKKVLHLSIAAAILAIANQVVSVALRQSFNPAVSFLVIACALAVPGCGYFGARNSDKNLTCLFCCCNCAGVVSTIVLAILSYVGYEAMKRIVDQCRPGYDECDGVDWTKICPSKTPAQCWKQVDDSLPTQRTALIFAAIFALPGCILQFASFWFGKQLHDELSGGVVVQPPMRPQVAVLPVQPVQFQGQGVRAVPVQAVQAVPAQGMQAYQGTSVQAVPVQGMQGVQPVQPTPSQAFQS